MAVVPHIRTEAPGPELRIVPMRRRHLRAVTRIEGAVCPRPWSIGLFLSELGAGPSRRYLVARAEGAVVGYGGLMVGAGEGHVTTLAVDPGWQRRSVGTHLLLALVEWGLEQGCSALTLEVRIGNLGAQALYRRFGFVPAGVRPGYYAETNEDALVMWAHDVDAPAYAERLAAIAARSAPAGSPGGGV